MSAVSVNSFPFTYLYHPLCQALLLLFFLPPHFILYVSTTFYEFFSCINFHTSLQLLCQGIGVVVFLHQLLLFSTTFYVRASKLFFALPSSALLYHLLCQGINVFCSTIFHTSLPPFVLGHQCFFSPLLYHLLCQGMNVFCSTIFHTSLPTFIRALFPSRAPRLAISGRMRPTPKERKLYLQKTGKVQQCFMK